MDIDKLLKPYEDEQPEHIPTESKLITRIPLLVTQDGINPEFQEFYEHIVEAIIKKDYSSLSTLSDQVLPIRQFIQLVESTWGKHFDEYREACDFGKSIDIELNINRFKQIHRNIIGGFYIITYHTNIKDDEFHPDKQITELKQAHTEILFSYREPGEFVMLSVIKPFTYEEQI